MLHILIVALCFDPIRSSTKYSCKTHTSVCKLVNGVNNQYTHFTITSIRFLKRLFVL